MKIAQTPLESYEKDQYLLADLAYENSPWVVPAYGAVVAQNEDYHTFDYFLAKSRVRIEKEIGILQAWWFYLREMWNQMRDKQGI
ncbi:hypothetical protein O181_006007 [Austropuccinia psidii MF-1]|uniref:DDE Tnp4 domain-containing protein n=1 Tax=Austropuccinia psidii MF-1 TaxID=1389203 RepID=A0A9Q3BJV9_9BASI|nr:hypothetical protein [Austropuccinia psidii MF-1]